VCSWWLWLVPGGWWLVAVFCGWWLWLGAFSKHVSHMLLQLSIYFALPVPLLRQVLKLGVFSR
jgi:hypothetical protein